MSTEPNSPTRQTLTAEEFDQLCRSVHLPITTQRRVIYETLAQMCNHPTADMLCDVVIKKLPRISRTSVYRILDVLTAYGIIQRIVTPGHATRYDARIDRHCHLFCTVCESITDWIYTPLSQLPLPEDSPNGFAISDCSFTFLGVCAQCQKKAKSSEESH